MSDLLAELQSPKNDREKRCGLRMLEVHLDAAEWDQICLLVDEIRHQPRIAKSQGKTAAWLGKVLREHGHSVSDSIISRHIRKACCCND